MRAKLRALAGVFLKLSRGLARQWAVLAAASGTALLAGLSAPYLIKLTVDEGIGKKDFAVFLAYCGAAALALLAKRALESYASLKGQALTEKLRFDLNRRLFQGLHAMPWPWFCRSSAGQAVVHLQEDSAAAIDLPASAAAFLNDGLKAALALGALFAFDPRIGAFMVLFLPILHLAAARNLEAFQDLWRESASNEEQVVGFLEESFWRAYLVKLFRAGPAAARRYARLLLAEMRLTLKRERREAALRAVPSALPLLAAGAVYVWSGYLAIHAGMSLGSLAAVGGYIHQFISAAGGLFDRWRDLSPGLVAAERLQPLLEAGRGEGASGPALAGGSVSMRGLRFSYPEGPPVFDQFSLEVPSGDFVVLSGPSGCGKTTLLNLLMRLLVPEQGAILLDGKDIGSLGGSAWGRDVVLCPQEPMLWNLSVAENIAYPRRALAEVDLRDAAALSGADKFIAALENGFGTRVGENAARLSQGQRQRLSLSRALAKRPRILLLDEAFSGLPEDEEARLLAALRERFPSMTIVSATHRLSALQGLGRVVRLGG